MLIASFVTHTSTTTITDTDSSLLIWLGGDLKDASLLQQSTLLSIWLTLSSLLRSYLLFCSSVPLHLSLSCSPHLMAWWTMRNKRNLVEGHSLVNSYLLTQFLTILTAERSSDQQHPWTALSNHSCTIVSAVNSRGIPSKAFSISTKTKCRGLFLVKYFTCSCFIRNITLIELLPGSKPNGISSRVALYLIS